MAGIVTTVAAVTETLRPPEYALQGATLMVVALAQEGLQGPLVGATVLIPAQSPWSADSPESGTTPNKIAPSPAVEGKSSQLPAVLAASRTQARIALVLE